MACYPEEEVWKCPKHPSKRRHHGICPLCLRDRLATLCPHCASDRPCSCADQTPSFTSDPSLHRSRSVAIPFLRAGSGPSSRTPSFLSILRRSKTKRRDPAAETKNAGDDRIDDFARMVTRSRSVSAGAAAKAMAPRIRPSDAGSSPAKAKFWHFPSPMTVFRSSKASKVVVHDRSPLPRG